MSRGIRPTRGVWGARGASPGGLSTSRSWPSRRGRRGTPLSGPPGERSGHTLRWRARRSSRPLRRKLRTSAPGPRGPARSSTARAAPDGAAPDAPPRARAPATRRRQIRLTKPAPRRRRSPRPRRRPRRAVDGATRGRPRGRRQSSHGRGARRSRRRSEARPPLRAIYAPARASPAATRARSPATSSGRSNLQPDLNVRVCDRFDTISSAVLRELDESNRSVQESRKSVAIAASGARFRGTARAAVGVWAVSPFSGRWSSGARRS